jgi:hypothetical protein
MPARRRRRRRPSARWTSASSIRSRFREGFGYPATCSDAVEKSKCGSSALCVTPETSLDAGAHARQRSQPDP